ncbi:GNAT family N-acetyltransferase [Hymenobacter lapidarius]|uniref:GNAT family N-acetyltransferase n=1 Tax=Hymenobacter lapidarius TaxID=1908237 RepID=A0A1G1T636_9BACT|nr:GNAT family protein [Hymenobacter lapidarius]OGX86284.1 GNAT family N-acetyltransferase [Hymenobacter lapidarius]
MPADPVFPAAHAPAVYLRALEPEDLDFLFALENDADIWGVSDTLAPVSRHALREYLAHASADFYLVRQLRLVVTTEIGRTPVGVVDLFDYDPLHQRAGIGITVLATERRHGYARQALALMKEHARRVLRLHQLYATVGADNTPSMKLFHATGFRQVGTRQQWLRTPGGWLDAVEWQCLL